MAQDYNIINAHDRDKLIQFNKKEHKYSVDGKEFISVTTLIEDCFPKFDADYWAARKAPQLGITPELLKAQWVAKAQRACELGTAMHDKIEKFYMGITSQSDETFDLFLQFTKEHTLYPYRTEWRIFYEEYGIAGTLDFLECKDGVFTIYDWKRSEKLVKNGIVEIENPWHKTALPPVSHLADTTYYHYALQVSIYRYILEKKYNIIVSQNRLAVFHPNNHHYYLINLPYLKREVEIILKHHTCKTSRD